MASPQKENGFTPIANEILEHLIHPGINGSELKLLLFVIRKTYGWGKKQDKIPLSQFSKALLSKRSSICRTIKTAVAKRLLHKANNTYKFNKNWEEWVVAKRLHSSQTANGSSSQTANGIVAKRLHSKETISKETTTKDILATQSVADDINPLIDKFKHVNPSYKKLFANTTQRAALQGVIASIGLEKTEKVLDMLPKTNAMQYAPSITTPLQLEQKLGQLIAFYQKEKARMPGLVKIS